MAELETAISKVTSDAELAEIFGAILSINGGNKAVCSKLDQVNYRLREKRKEIIRMRESGLSDEKIRAVFEIQNTKGETHRILESQMYKLGATPAELVQSAKDLVAAAQKTLAAYEEYARLF